MLTLQNIFAQLPTGGGRISEGDSHEINKIVQRGDHFNQLRVVSARYSAY